MNKELLFIKYGNKPELMIKDLLDKAQILKNIPKKDALIGIKPNLVLASPSEDGATTCPKIVEEIIKYLQGAAFNNIIILEGSWIGDTTRRAFKVCGYEDISRKYKVPLVDLQNDQAKWHDIKGVELHLCKTALDVDYMINVPVLKGHCQTRITCALKNMKGCITNKEKRRFHTMGLHKPIAHLGKALKQDLIVVDGIIGDLNFEEGGNPVQMNRIIVGKDPVLVDSYVAELLGYEKSEIPYIGMAEALGVGCSEVTEETIMALNKDKHPMVIPKSYQVQKLEKYIDEDMACSSCYASLMHALDRLEDRGQLNYVNEKIKIGQGFKDKSGEGIGVGICTRGYSKSVPGCPPKAKAIIDLLAPK